MHINVVNLRSGMSFICSMNFAASLWLLLLAHECTYSLKEFGVFLHSGMTNINFIMRQMKITKL